MANALVLVLVQMGPVHLKRVLQQLVPHIQLMKVVLIINLDVSQMEVDVCNQQLA